MSSCSTSLRLARTGVLHLARPRGPVPRWLPVSRPATFARPGAVHFLGRSLATVSGDTHAHAAASSHSSGAHNLPRSETDIAIVGAGPAGLAVACGLAHDLAQSGSQTGLRVSVLEASPLASLRSFPRRISDAGQETQEELPWSNRVVSVTAKNMAWLETIGVAPRLVWSRIRAMTDMHVSDILAPPGTELHFDVAELGEDDPTTWSATSNGPTHVLSYLVEIANLQHAMLSYLSSLSNAQVTVQVRDQTRVADIVAYDAGTPGAAPVEPHPSPNADQWPVLTLDPRDGPQEHLTARLLVGADSPRGPVGKYARIGAFGHQYDRRGLVSTLRCVLPPPPPPGFGGVQADDPLHDSPTDPNDPHAGLRGHTAWQRFLPSGPIAFLPVRIFQGERTSTVT